MRGRIFLIRYTDNFVIGLEFEDDARKVMEVVPKHLLKYCLNIHPESLEIMKKIRKAVKGYYKTQLDKLIKDQIESSEAEKRSLNNKDLIIKAIFK